jgi:uncharacterized protein (TIGR03437 family)
MDATHKYFSKTVLFLATALLMVAPGLAQPTFVLNGTSNTASISLGTGYVAVSVVASDGSAIAFTPAVVYANEPNFVNNWLRFPPTSSNGFATPTTLYFSVANTSGMVPGVTYQATVTLNSSGPSGTINVSFTYGSSIGGGTLTPSQNSVALSAASGSSTSTQISLINNSGNTVGFTIPAPTTTSGGAWLTASANTYTVTTTGFATLTIGASAANLSSGQYLGTVTITPNGGGLSSQIGVTFTVGAGGTTGNLTASPSSTSWSYTTGSAVTPSTTVALTSATGATGFSTSVNSNNSWLYTTPTSGNISSGFQILASAAISSLATGNYTGYVYVQDTNGYQTTITVYLVVNGGSTSGITWSPDPVVLPTAAVNGSTVSQTVYLNSATVGTFTASVANVTGSGLYISGVTTTSTSPSPAAGYVVVYGNPSGLASNTYSGYLYVTLTPSASGASAVNQTIPVSFPVGTGTSTTPGVVTPTSLTFAYQTGTTVTGQSLPAQSIVVTGTGTLSVSAPTYTSGQTGGWLTTLASSTNGPATISVNVNPTGLAASPTPYTATVTVTVGGVVSTVSVSFLVTASPVLVVYPGTLNSTYTAGGTDFYSTLFLNASDNSAMPLTVTTSTSWLSVNQPGGPNTNTSVGVYGNNLPSLANGVYTGSVMVSATGAANSPVNVPVVLTVTGSTATGGSLTLSSSSLTFSAQVSGSQPVGQTLAVSASPSASYTASASSTGNWLSISPTGSLTTSANPALTVSVNQSGLTANTYYGTITLVANGITQTVQVTLVVSSSTSTGGAGNVTVTANGVAGTPSLAFTYTVGGSAPTPQTLQVVSASGSAPVSFTISSNATWLSAGVTNGTSLNTPVNNPGFTVGIVTPVSLTASTTPYNATITITPNGGTVVTVPVTLTVQAAAAVTATPTMLSFAYQAGNANPTPATVSVSGGGQSLGFTAAVTNGSNWLSVSPTSGTTPTTGTSPLTVTATPGNLGAGSYNGTILVSGTGTATGSTSITVTLTVTAPLPTITSVVNAASFIQGPVSPGEIITIFGTAIGPATAAGATTNPTTGKLATNIGGVQVLFNGIPAPMIYASNTQVSAVVPYEIAPIATPAVWIQYVGQTSNAYQLTSATTMPGVFTQNASGSGPGAILNQNNSLNGPGNPAAKGSIVQLFMTGEGQTSPPSVTGALTTTTLPPPQVTPAPLLKVAVLINGQPASYTYAGEAPGLVAGVMQLNVQIPATAQSGVPNSITVSIGPNTSQNNVTVSVQ